MQCALLRTAAVVAEPIWGSVYLDLNSNGKRDPDEPGLAKVPVTDGVQFVTSGPDGSYELMLAADPILSAGGAPIISVRFPSGYWPVTPWFIRLSELKPGSTVDFGLRPQEQTLPFVFIHGTDAHVPREGKARFQLFRREIEAMKGQLPFAVLTGDLTEASDSQTYDQARAAFGFLGEQLAEFPVPLFCLTGNHDMAGVNAKPAWDPHPADQGYGFYTRVVGPLRWSFDYANIHFVGVDFNHPVNGKWGWGPPASAVQWLDRDLDQVPASRRIFLFVHSPMDTNGLAEVVRKHPVTQIFHGHDHQDRAWTFAGVPALSGGSLSKVYEDKDRAAGYRVTRVTATGIESFYRTTGEPHSVALDTPRKPDGLRAGQRVAGAVWDPGQEVRQLSFRLGEQEQPVTLEAGSLWRRFDTELKLAATSANATNFIVNVSDGSLSWQTAIFKEAASTTFLFALDPATTLPNLAGLDARAQLASPRALRVSTGHSERWPGVTFKVPQAPCDLSAYLRAALTVRNLGNRPLTVFARLDNPGADGTKNCLNGSIALGAGEAGELQLNLNPTPWRLADPVNLVGMRAAPGKSAHFDAAKVSQLLVFLHEPKEDNTFEVGPVTLSGRVQNLAATSFFPFIDEFGQFIHADWPGKTKSLEDFAAQKRLEEKDMKDHAQPTDWDEYGGWAEGPKVDATGFFRVEKRDGKWWLVTPAGRLFWSQGIDCVTASEITPLSDRAHYFRNLPKPEEPLGRFHGTGTWAPVGYYTNHTPYQTYDFARANLQRKYGDAWPQAYAEMAHRRLRSWGLNTIGNWSDGAVNRGQRTPYTATVSNGARVIEGSEGYWGKFMDVFDPSFRQSVRANMERQQGAAKDPWCIGFFVDNELSWGNETSLAEAALLSPPSQPAKLAFLGDLKEKYGDIGKLNEAWGGHYESWDALRENREKPNLGKADADLKAFYTKIAETYFQVVREEVKRAAPNHLYLGCRFAWINERALRAAAKYCDVLSCNIYEYNIDRLNRDIDKPYIIGEFHFGALDRGLFHAGLKPTRDQADRALKYSNYLKGALRHPLIVGAHWFQYQDQPTTGRGDGENYQIGFVDICDRPYPEIVQASRAIGEHLYDTRAGDAPRK